MKYATDTSNKIEATESAYLFMKVSQLPNAGLGLYTAIDIYKDETVSVFKGEILTEEQAKLRAKKGNDQYFINMVDGSIMDSRKVTCFAKYSNDAQGFVNSGFKNNTEIALDENENVCLIAIRNIKSGEEIFCGYGKRYWKKHREIKS